MSLKCVISLKRVSEERDLSLGSDGFIGKCVPLSPTFLGIFILRQYYSKKFSNQLEKDLPSFFGKRDLPSVGDLPSFLKGGKH